jgi:hypothetical protein
MHDETAATLAYDEIVRRISGQMQVLAGLRARAGTLFGAASLATSFLSGVAAKGGSLGLGAPGWAAVALFALATAITLLMFLSHGGLSFTIQRQENEELLAIAPTEMTVADTYRAFARRLEFHYAENARRMKWYFHGMWVLCLVVGAELLLWTLDFVS